MLKHPSAILIVFCFLAITWGILSCQEKPKSKPESKPEEKLLPGEIKTTRYPVPVITSMEDTRCSDSTGCPANGADCNCKRFVVYFIH